MEVDGLRQRVAPRTNTFETCRSDVDTQALFHNLHLHVMPSVLGLNG